MCRNVWTGISAAMAAIGAALALSPLADAHSHPVAASPHPSAKRGLVYKGLVPAREGRCRGGFRVPLKGPDACTHGPDPAPPGVDVRRRRSPRAIAADPPGGIAPAASPTESVPCDGDGKSGDRVEAIYAVAADQDDRYGEVEPLIEQWAANISREVDDSAAETGGRRTVRFVTSSCELVVRHEVLSATGDDSFDNMVRELQSRGYTRADRKYLVWMDANVVCGLGVVAGQWSRVDNGCWNYAETHELIHNLGGVALDAPNSSGGGHCTDESDDMCYSDMPDFPQMRQICPTWHERRLDCGHDDYFSTAPPAGSWLAEHPSSNTAESSFLIAEDGESPSYLPEAPAGYSGPRFTLRLDNSDDQLCAYGIHRATGEQQRLFCVGYMGSREADITGALLKIADGGDTAVLRRVAVNHGGVQSYGFELYRNGSIERYSRDGEAGVWSADDRGSGRDPVTGYTTFYDETDEIQLNYPPEAAFAVTPNHPAAGQQVAFSSEAMDYDGRVVSERWDLDGDGQFDDARGSNPTWTYRSAGSKTVRLAVRDDWGARAVATRRIVVGSSLACRRVRAKRENVKREIADVRTRLQRAHGHEAARLRRKLRALEARLREARNEVTRLC